MKLLIPTNPPLDHVRAAFMTHLNYVRRLDDMLSQFRLSVKPKTDVIKKEKEIGRFVRLEKVTQKSIERDIELSTEDNAFAVIAAPWFPVKCYYSLYYLESILSHLIDGNSYGFGKGGHGGIRKKITELITDNRMILAVPELNRAYSLAEIDAYPPINSGINARSDFWKKPECLTSLSGKLMEYKLHDAQSTNKWDLRTKQGRKDKAEFIATKSLMLLDFFFWYRIKANYRDLDYIDFENGITEQEVLEYMRTYYSAYLHYRNQLVEQINHLR